MRRYTLLRLLPMLLVVLALVGLGVWLVPQLRAPQGRTYRFYIEDASGLPEGTEVKFRGLVVGQVTQVMLDEARSREKQSPWFEVAFQPVPGGEKVLSLWSFRAVLIEKETPLVGATVVTLADSRMPGGETPGVLELQVAKGDDLSGDLHDITAGIKQVVANANDAMLDLKKELESRPDGPFDPNRPTRIAAMLGSLQDAAHQLALASDHISTITDAKGAVTVAFDKFGALSDDLTNDSRPFLSTFTDFKKSSAELRLDLVRTGRLLDAASPNLERGTANAAQMLDTLKREPWRLVWKSTKEYDDSAKPSPTPAPAAKGRKQRQTSER